MSDPLLFSEDRLQQLINKYNSGAQQLWATYAQKCEIVYEISKETKKRGCKSTFSATLQRLQPPLSYSVGHYMVVWHETYTLKIHPDPDASDERDRPEPDASDDGTQSIGKGTNRRDESSAGARPASPKQITISLKGQLAKAVESIRKYHRYKDAKTAIVESVLRYYRQLSTPTVKQFPRRSASRGKRGQSHVA